MSEITPSVPSTTSHSPSNNPTPDPEKVSPTTTISLDNDLDQLGEREGYILDATLANSSRRHLKTTSDGKTILIPQPSDDPADPLNWSQTRKNIVLIVISCAAFLTDYGAATGAVTLIPQAAIWGMSPDTVNHSQAGNAFMNGAGGIVAVVLSAYFGRLPVLFWFIVLALATTIWCTAAQLFDSFMAARILAGTFSSVGAAIGLIFVKDLFYFHEHARKINTLTAFIILSPYLGPLLAAFITSTQKWQWAFGVYTIQISLVLIAIILLGEETYYNRRLPSQPPKGSKLQRLVGISQWRSRHLRNSFGEAVWRTAVVISRPTVFLSCVYYLITFAWAVGINSTLAIFLGPLYGFGLKQIGYFYFTPLVATLLGYMTGHWLHDLLATWYTRRHHGKFEPEARLIICWIGGPFMAVGLILLGFALERRWHFMVTALGWGFYVFGIMVNTVGITAYVLDSYPEASGEVNAWINFSRVIGGFIISYEQVTWAHAEGTEVTFGVQAAIASLGLVVILGLQVFGKRLRRWSGGLGFRTT